MTNFKAVVFDLDGTLVDSLSDLAISANAAVAQMGFPVHSVDEVKTFVGNGVGKLISRSLPNGVEPSVVDDCLDIFRRFYDCHLLDNTKPYDGIVDMLESMKKNGIFVAVLSNKYDAAVKRITSSLFGPLVDCAFGESDLIPRKPSPDGLMVVVDKLGLDLADVIFVGDSDVDIQTARNAGVKSVGVLWGFKPDSLIEAQPDYLVSTPDQLLQLVV